MGGEVATLRTRRTWHTMKLRAELEGGGWRRMWDEGVGDIIKRREAWLERNAPNLDAVFGPEELLGPWTE